MDGLCLFDWKDDSGLYRFSHGTAGFRVAAGDNSFADFAVHGIPVKPAARSSPAPVPASFSCEDFRGPDGPRYWQFDRREAFWGLLEDGSFGTLRTGGYTAATLHGFERDTELEARLRLSPSPEGGEAGLLLRYAHEQSGLKIGYSFEKNAWVRGRFQGRRLSFPKALVRGGGPLSGGCLDHCTGPA